MTDYTFTVSGAVLSGGQTPGDITVTGTLTVFGARATSVLITSITATSSNVSAFQGIIGGLNFVTNAPNGEPEINMFTSENIFNFNGEILAEGGGTRTWSLIFINNVNFSLREPSNLYSITNGAITISRNGLPCFVEGTRLLTQNGYKAIETLTSEDRLLTTEHRSTSLQLTRIHVPRTTKATAPYVLAAGALGENIPSVPLYLSPSHKFTVRDNVWVHASKGATLGLDIKQCRIGTPVTYYHVRCENYARDVILAEGVATESLANLKEDSVTFRKTNKAGVFLRNEYKEPTQVTSSK